MVSMHAAYGYSRQRSEAIPCEEECVLYVPYALYSRVALSHMQIM